MPANFIGSLVPDYFREALGRDSNGKHDHGTARRGDDDDRCTYSTVRKSHCSVGQNDDGKPVMKCEKTEQRLKHCLGRPAEVVDSKTEYTEEDVPNDSFSIWDNKQNTEVPGLKSGFPPSLSSPFLREIPGDVDSIFQVVDELFGKAFNQFPWHGPDEDNEMKAPRGFLRSRPFGWQSPNDSSSWKAGGKDQKRQQKVPDYSSLSKAFEEV